MNIKKNLIYASLAIVVSAFLYYENNSLSVTRISLYFEKLPKSFNNYKVVQLSDLHEKEFGKDNINLISKIKAESPDVIFITGDLINAAINISRQETKVLNLLKSLRNIAPVYYVTGNHEISTYDFYTLEKKAASDGIVILRNNSTKLSSGNESISLLGIDDPEYANPSSVKLNAKLVTDELNKVTSRVEDRNFKILLSHRPEHFDIYSKKNIDLIFSGHAHGGQIRLPYLGGLYVPNQGLFPKYTEGSYSLGNSTMIVSRGLGNSKRALRIFNKPEIMIVTLLKK